MFSFNFFHFYVRILTDVIKENTTTDTSYWKREDSALIFYFT